MYDLTMYGLAAGIGMFVGLSMLPNISIALIFTVILTFIIKSVLCEECKGVFSLSGFLGIFPILLLFTINDCKYLKAVLVAFATACTIGRIGCYFVGCCTGKVCNENNPLSINYDYGSVIVDKYTKKPCSVYPTVYLEVILQALIAYFTWFSAYGISLFGLGNASLLMLTTYWRAQSRENQYFSINSLLLVSVLSLFLCKGEKKCCITWSPKIMYAIIAAATSFITSNNIYL